MVLNAFEIQASHSPVLQVQSPPHKSVPLPHCSQFKAISDPQLTALGPGSVNDQKALLVGCFTFGPKIFGPETFRPKTFGPGTIRPMTIRPKTIWPKTIRPKRQFGPLYYESDNLAQAKLELK